VDGNFSMQNMYMKRPLEDIALTDKEGYAVEDLPYREHLEESIEYKQVLFSENHYIQIGKPINDLLAEIYLPQSQSSQCW